MLLKSEKKYYPSLNGLRAISIALVILNHFSIKANIFSALEKYFWLKPIKDLLEDGQLGVTIFFVISGFLITTLMLNEEEKNDSISIKKFYIRRIFRIFPAYYFMLFVYFLLQMIGFVHLSGYSWLTSLTYTKYLNWTIDGITCHAWSLSVEENFYLLWPLVFTAGKKTRKSIAVIITIAIPFVRLYISHYPVSWISELSIFTRLDSITIGCLFAFYKERIINIINNNWNSIFYSSITFLFLIRYLSNISSGFNLNFIINLFGTTHGTIASFLIGIIIFYSVFGPKNYWHSFLNLRLVNFIGLISYSLYLWQQIFTNNTKYWVTLIPYNIFLITIMTLFSYYVIETPFLKMKNRFYS